MTDRPADRRDSARSGLPADTTEADFQALVVDYARYSGWRVAHFAPARTEKGWRTPARADGAGFPDLVLARNGQIILAELKSAKGRPTADQTEWLTALGHYAHLWHPSDWPNIREMLT